MASSTQVSSSIYPRRVIEDLAAQHEPGLVFLLQPINPEFESVLAAIRSVGKDKNLIVRRADDIKKPGAIVSQVVENICKADIVIADLTDRNANVFYEMGIGHAVREDLILLTQDVESVPFDLRHLRLVPYSKSRLARLRADLSEAIDEILALPHEMRGTRPPQVVPARDLSDVLESRNLSDINLADFGRNGDTAQLAVREHDCKADCQAFVVLSLVPDRPTPVAVDTFWQWLDSRRTTISDKMHPLYGDDFRPRGDSVLIRKKSGSNQSKLTRYTLFTRSGYIEWGRALGGCHEELCTVRLAPLLVAVWRLVELRLDLTNEFRRPSDTLVVSIANARGTVLSHLGQGWSEPWPEFRQYAPKCEDAHVQLMRPAPSEETAIMAFLKDVDVWINRSYGHDGARGFNHPDFGNPDELDPRFVNYDPWES